MDLTNGNGKIIFRITDFFKWMLEAVIIVGTAVALYYNLTNEFNLVKADIYRMNKDIEELKSEIKFHIREGR